MAKVEGIAKVKVDGQEAGKQLEVLEAKAKDLRREIVKIQKEKLIDPKQLKDLKNQLKTVDSEMKKVKNSTFQYKKVLDNLSGASFNDLKKAHRELNKEVAKLDRNTEAYKKKASNLSAVKTEMSKYRAETGKASKEMNNAGNSFDKFTGKIKIGIQQFTMFVAGISAAVAVIIAFDRKIKETSKLQNKIRFQFDETGASLDNLTLKVMILSDRLDEDVNETLKAANVFYKEFSDEISKTEAFDLIIDAAEKGANANGDLLDMLKEYPAQLKQVGLSAEESLAIMTQQVKEGVFSDKGIDAIKEAGIRLREMTPATIAALEGIGLSSKEIQKGLQDGTKTMFQVIQDVSGRLNKVKDDSPEVGAALADVFGGAGEDAGLRYIKTLENINLNFEDLESTVDETTEAQNRLNDAWNETILQTTKGTGVIGKIFISLKTDLANILETINIFSSGDWLVRVKILANSMVDTLLFLFKPFLFIIEKITGEDLLAPIKFDIDKKSSTMVARGLKRIVVKVEEEITAEQKKEIEKRKKLLEQQYKERIKANEQISGLIQSMNLQLITDARQKAEQEVQIWYDKEKRKIETSKASAKLKAEAVESLENLHTQKLLDIDAKYNKETLKRFSDVESFLKQQQISLEADRDAILQRDIEKIQAKYDAKILIIEEELLKEGELNEEFELQKAELEKLREDEIKAYKLQKEEEFKDQLLAVREKYGLVTQQEQFIEELAKLDEHLTNKLLSESDYEKAKAGIQKKYRDKKIKEEEDNFKKEIDIQKKSIQDKQAVISALSNFISAAKEAELTEVGDNEEAKKEIMKKYADKEFAVKAAQIIANTALAIMQALAQLGPIAGGIASVLIGITGAIQLGIANSERQRIKGLAEGGEFPVIREQDGKNFNAVYGGNKSGLFTKPTVLVAEDGPEYVIPYSGLQNPEIRSFVGAIESARSAGSLHDFNYQKAITAGSKLKGYAEGGFTETTQNVSESNEEITNLLIIMIQEIQALRDSVDKKNELLKAYVSYDDIEEAIETMDNLKDEVTIE